MIVRDDIEGVADGTGVGTGEQHGTGLAGQAYDFVGLAGKCDHRPARGNQFECLVVQQAARIVYVDVRRYGCLQGMQPGLRQVAFEMQPDAGTFSRLTDTLGIVSSIAQHRLTVPAAMRPA